MRGAALVAMLVAGSAWAQRVATPFQLDVPVPWASWGVQRFPAVAFTGADFVVVWQDDRDAVSNDVWFVRIGGPSPVPQSNAPLLARPGEQTAPALAVGSSSLLLAWLEADPCGTAVFAQRFTLQLQPQGPPVRLSTGCTTERPVVAWSAAAQRYLVAWGRDGAGLDVRGALLDEAGLSLTPSLIGSGPNAAQTPAVVAQGAGFVVAWADDRLLAGQPNVWVTTVAADGAVADPAQASPLAAAQTTPCLATAGSDLLAVWDEGPELVAQRLTAGLSPVGARVSVVTGTVNRPACAEAAPGLVAIAFEDGRDTGSGVFVRTVDGAGAVGLEAPAAPRQGYFSRWRPQLAAGGGRVLIAAYGETDYVNDDDVVWRLLDVTGPALSADAGVGTASVSAAPQQRVVGAYDGLRYLAAWRDQGRYSGGSEAHGQLLEPGTGQWLTDGGFAITAGTHNLGSYPSPAAREGNAFFVSWGDDGSNGALIGRTVSATGTLGARQRLNDASSYVSHHVTRWFGGAFVTLFLKSGTLRLRRGDAAGVTVQPETTVLATGTAPEFLSAALTGGVLLAAWVGADAGVDVFAARFDADGGLLDAEPLRVSQTPGAEADVSVAGSGGVFAVAWSAPEDGGANAPREVYVARVSSAGQLLDAPPLALGRGEHPAVGWWGSRFLVAWSREGDVVGATLDPVRPLVGGRFPIAAGPTVERRPFVTSGPPGEVLVTFERYVPEPPYQAFRAHGVIVSDAPALDAGAPEDGGAGADAGSTFDGGATADGGAGDGGTPAPGERRELAIGCGCTSAGLPPLALLALLVLRRGATARAR